jgi:hypothetical protein
VDHGLLATDTSVSLVDMLALPNHGAYQFSQSWTRSYDCECLRIRKGYNVFSK